MAEAALSKLSLILTTNATQMYSGLKDAASGATSWAKGIASNISNVLGKSAFGSLGKGLQGGLMGLLTPMKSVALAGLGMGKDFFAEQSEKIKELNKTGMQAKSLGLLSEDFMSLSMQAGKLGIETDTLSKSLIKFNASTADAGALGLNLDNKTLMEKFEAVADKIASIPDAAHQASAAIEVFGKAGPALLPLLQQGSKGIEEFKKKQLELGNVLGQGDMNRVQLAAKAIPKLGEMWSGFQQKITVATAPLIMTFGRLFDWIMPTLQKVVTFAADIYSNYLSGMATLWEMVFTWGGELVTQVVEIVKGWNLLGGETTSMKEIFDGVFRFVGKGVAWIFDTIKASAGITLGAIGALVKGIGKIGELAGADWGGKWAEAGDQLMKTGNTWINTFGDSAGKVDAFFDKVAARNKELENNSIKTAGAIKSEYVAISTIISGTKEAAALEAKFRTNNLVNPQVQNGRDQLNELKKVNVNLERLVKREPINVGFGEV